MSETEGRLSLRCRVPSITQFLQIFREITLSISMSLELCVRGDTAATACSAGFYALSEDSHPSSSSQRRLNLIIPLTPESEWQACLSEIPRWDPPKGPTLVVAPHPDDETLGAGGLIAGQRARGIDVAVAAVTDGENCYPGVLGLGRIRRLEQESALRRLGVERDEIVRFELTDSAVSSSEEELTECLMRLVSENTHIVAPWPGHFHPDHEACGRAAREVARRVGCGLTFYFFWTWHRGTPQLIQDLPLKSLSLDQELVDAKTQALLQYQSQLVRDTDEPILSELLLAPARRSYEVFLAA